MNHRDVTVNVTMTVPDQEPIPKRLARCSKADGRTSLGDYTSVASCMVAAGASFRGQSFTVHFTTATTRPKAGMAYWSSGGKMTDTDGVIREAGAIN